VTLSHHRRRRRRRRRRPAALQRIIMPLKCKMLPRPALSRMFLPHAPPANRKRLFSCFCGREELPARLCPSEDDVAPHHTSTRSQQYNHVIVEAVTRMTDKRAMLDASACVRLLTSRIARHTFCVFELKSMEPAHTHTHGMHCIAGPNETLHAYEPMSCHPKQPAA
jgi:hypothetical protein